MKCRTHCNPVEDLWCTVSLLFLHVHYSHTITYFSLEMSYLFQLLFTEFIFSLLGLQETVQFLFLLGLNMLLKLLFFIGHHFSLQQISSKLVWVPKDYSLCPISASRPRTHGSHHNIHHTSAQAQVRGACLHSLLIPHPIKAPSRVLLQCHIPSTLLFS